MIIVAEIGGKVIVTDMTIRGTVVLHYNKYALSKPLYALYAAVLLAIHVAEWQNSQNLQQDVSHGGVLC